MDLKVEDLADDLYFADLNKQISLLIMDDEEPHSFSSNSSLSVQAVSHVPQPPVVAFPAVYEVYLRKESKGTGVFIPRFAVPRKKGRPGKPKAQTNQTSNPKKSPIASQSYCCCNQR